MRTLRKSVTFWVPPFVAIHNYDSVDWERIKKGVWFHYDEHMGLQQASRNEERFLAHKVEILNEND